MCPWTCSRLFLDKVLTHAIAIEATRRNSRRRMIGATALIVLLADGAITTADAAAIICSQRPSIVLTLGPRFDFSTLKEEDSKLHFRFERGENRADDAAAPTSREDQEQLHLRAYGDHMHYAAPPLLSRSLRRSG